MARKENMAKLRKAIETVDPQKRLELFTDVLFVLGGNSGITFCEAFDVADRLSKENNYETM